MLKITMAHLVLFCFILNLTDACPELPFSEVSYRAGTGQLFCGANHATGSCIVHGFAGGCFPTDFSCLIFDQYLSLSLVQS